MRKEKIEELIRLVEESQITELEICDGKEKIRISKSSTAAGAVQRIQSPESEGNVGSVLDEVPAPTNVAEGSKLASNLKQIVSPMVGTFYRSPAPEADPFVEVGESVQLGQTVCIVEAMKVMNEIGSDYSGVIRKVLIENSQPVEYGQPLFLVESK